MLPAGGAHAARSHGDEGPRLMGGAADGEASGRDHGRDREVAMLLDRVLWPPQLCAHDLCAVPKVHAYLPHVFVGYHASRTCGKAALQ